MKKAVWISITVVAVLVIGVAVWWLVGSSGQSGSTTELASSTVERTDFTAIDKPTVTIRDLSFTPANIRVRVGATVVWTNKDGAAHSVVADDDTQAGDLPTDTQLFGKNETFQITFKQLGTFRYHCIPHTFMHGSVEVVE